MTINSTLKKIWYELITPVSIYFAKIWICKVSNIEIDPSEILKEAEREQSPIQQDSPQIHKIKIKNLAMNKNYTMLSTQSLDIVSNKDIMELVTRTQAETTHTKV